MNKIVLSMAAMGAIAVAAPATAQSWSNSNSNYNAGGGMGIENRIAQLDARIQAGVSTGEINRTEARSLRMQVRQLRDLERRYSYNGLTQSEREDLRSRLRELREDVQVADNGRYDRDSRYSWDDRYDNNNNSGYSGRGGPYEQPYDNYCDTSRRGGIGGLIEGVLGGGRSNDNCSLRVGSRASGNLYSVPSEYRYRFRDGNGVYYRSDGRNIYQIDARSQTVLRIYDIN
ncbi:MAG TPA: hypothetical protein VE891_10505 [Allosphingosinicella sp.]|nr:hypothetical protein [Allosphingosinicella sp.]